MRASKGKNHFVSFTRRQRAARRMRKRKKAFLHRRRWYTVTHTQKESRKKVTKVCYDGRMLKPTDGTSFRLRQEIGKQSGRRAVVGNKKLPKWNCAMIMTTTTTTTSPTMSMMMIKLDKFTLSTPALQLLWATSIQFVFCRLFFPMLHYLPIFESFFFARHPLFSKTNFISQPAVEWILSIFYDTIPLPLFFLPSLAQSFHLFKKERIALHKFDKFHKQHPSAVHIPKQVAAKFYYAISK